MLTVARRLRLHATAHALPPVMQRSASIFNPHRHPPAAPRAGRVVESAGDRRLAMDAAAAAQLERGDCVALAADHRPAAAGAVRVLVLGVEDVARINIAQPGVAGDVVGRLQASPAASGRDRSA